MCPSQSDSPLYRELGLHVSLVAERPACRVPLRFLVVDDNASHRRIASAMLRRRGYEVTCVNGGREAVVVLLTQHFDIVLMDIDMPGMDGIRATAEIRQREVLMYVYTPIVALTATDDYRKCFEAGMDGFTEKPLNVDRVEEILGVRAVVAPPPEACALTR